MNTKQQIEQTEKKLAELKNKLKEENNKSDWIKIPELKIEITNKQQFNGKTYDEILKLVKEEEIADYPLLQKLRNTGKYEFLKEFWVSVPNPDKISKDNNYCARFVADSGRAGLLRGRYRSYSDAGLGVFLIRSLK